MTEIWQFRLSRKRYIEKHLNHGTLHAQKTPTTIQNIYRNNTAFYLAKNSESIYM
jgi:hypothetical protein